MTFTDEMHLQQSDSGTATDVIATDATFTDEVAFGDNLTLALRLMRSNVQERLASGEDIFGPLIQK